ncbi:phospholipase [Methanothermococcus sp. SCGC AD-155-M21]|nr:phospholipase [Methanothermococcus sp. SCGC AD-155-M21]
MALILENTVFIGVVLLLLIFILLSNYIILKKLKILYNDIIHNTNVDVPEEDSIDKNRISILNDEKYYYHVLNAISSAEREIDIIMFSMYRCKKTEELLNELIRARKRGVFIRIILDKDIDSNKEVKNILGSEKIPIKLADDRRIHNKLIIIDKDILIVGSHNWTDKALFQNRESSVVIRDKHTIKKMKRYFESVWNSLK